jgi:hypothetical protein
MARIPGIVADSNVSTNLPQSGADAAAFGGQIGRAQEGLGGDLQSLAGGVLKYAETEKAKTDKSNIANAVAQFDYSKRFLDNQTKTGPGGAGFTEQTRTDYQSAVDDYTGKIDDPTQRQKVREHLISSLPQYTQSAATFEKNSGATYAKDNADKSLATLQNQIRVDPNSYDAIMAKGAAVIDASPAVPANVREEYKTKFGNDLAKSRFENLNAAAKTTDEVDAIEKQLTDKDAGWQAKMAPADFERALDQIRTNRVHIATKADAAANAAMDSLDGRTKSNQIVPPEEVAATLQLAKDSKNPAVLYRAAQLKADQDELATVRGLPPEALRARQEAMTGKRGISYPGLPNELSSAIDLGVARSGGQVSATYLGAVAQREYGGHLRPGPDGTVKWDVQAETSSATGVYQFIDKTWLGQMKKGDGSIPKSIGIDTTGMSDTQILALRSNPKLQAVAMASFTLENKNALQNAFPGRPVTDTDLYLAHFLGSGGATAFIRAYQANPNGSAAAATPDAAQSNNGVFYEKGTGKALSLATVYANVANSMGTAPGRVQAGRAEVTGRVLAETEKGVRDDLFKTGVQNGIVQGAPLTDAASYALRGKEAMQVASFYSVPLADAKPFTQDEAAKATATIKDGTADQVLSMMAQIQAMGPDMARAAYKQVGQSDSVFAHAAGLSADQGNMQVAGDIVRGQKRMQEDKGITDSLGKGYDQQSSDVFNQTVGGSLLGLKPDQLSAIRQAALAHYVQTQVGSGATPYGRLDSRAYASSIQAVMGGSTASPAVGTVNGAPTLLPKGLDAGTMERAVDNLQPADLIALSADGNPPKYADGTVVSPREIAREGKFRSVGGGSYTIQMADSRQLVSRVGADGQAVFYQMKADPATLKGIAARGGRSASGIGPAAAPSNATDMGVSP